MKLTSYTGGIAETNGWLLETEAGALVVDAPLGMEKWLAEQQLRPAALVLTHQHFDHVQAAAAISQQWGCPVYAWAAFSRELTLEQLGGRESALFHVPAFEVTHLLSSGPSLRLVGLDWQLSHIPGHSLDSVTLYNAELGLLFAGDVLFAGSVGRTDFPGGSSQTLISGITTHLLPLPDATAVLPGHGDDTTIGQERAGNPYLI
jgi:hydroxyacylglutathione hydrolase